MTDVNTNRYCPNCSCLGCQVANLRAEYESLRHRAIRHAHFSPSSEINIGGALGSLKYIPESMAMDSANLLDQFHCLLSRIVP